MVRRRRHHRSAAPSELQRSREAVRLVSRRMVREVDTDPTRGVCTARPVPVAISRTASSTGSCRTSGSSVGSAARGLEPDAVGDWQWRRQFMPDSAVLSITRCFRAASMTASYTDGTRPSILPYPLLLRPSPRNLRASDAYPLSRRSRN
jgi:hypothetical protein